MILTLLCAVRFLCYTYCNEWHDILAIKVDDSSIELTLTKQQLEILIHLVKNEMNGFCGDAGYEELSQIRAKLEQRLDTSESNV